MRLDTVGKPPLVQNDSFEKVKVDNVTIAPTPKTAAAADTDSNGAGNGKARLGKVLDLLQKDQEKKKKQNRGALTSDALRAYQRAAGAEGAEQSGQAVN